jgi:hypothetical protein
MGMLGACERHHGKAVRERREVLLEFMRRAAGRNEVDLIKIEAPVRCARNRQMASMNGVKGTAKKSDAPWMMLCRCAVRLRRRQTVPSDILSSTSSSPANHDLRQAVRRDARVAESQDSLMNPSQGEGQLHRPSAMDRALRKLRHRAAHPLIRPPYPRSTQVLECGPAHRPLPGRGP